MTVLGWVVVLLAFGVAMTVTFLLDREELAPRWLTVSVAMLLYLAGAATGFRLIESSWDAAFANAVISLALAVPAGVGVSLGMRSEGRT